MAIKNIGFIGLGAMGTPMATLLFRAGYPVKGFDIVGEQIRRLIPMGIKAARSPGEATEGSELILLSLPHWKAVQDAVDGKDGILKRAKEGQIIVDTTTAPPWESRAMALRLSKRKIHWMDVPVLAAPKQVMEGKAIFMVGGKKSVFHEIKPTLDKIGMKTVYVGKSGDAAMLKIAHNLILFLNEAAAIEGFTLGLKAGLDPQVMYEVIKGGTATSDLIQRRGEDMLAGNFKVKGSLAIGVKDVGLALDSARRLGVVLPISGIYHQYLLNAQYRGWDKEDATVVMRLYEEMSGLKREPEFGPSVPE